MPAKDHIFITGASGFVGRNILDLLAHYPVTALVRHESPDLQKRENVTTYPGNVTDSGSMHGLVDGATIVIHLAAVIEESGGATFDSVIRKGTEQVLAEAKRAGVRRFIHMSALGAMDDPRFPYLQAKWRAEQAVINSGLDYTILRPSVIFGPGDGFISTLANVVRSFPVVPIVGDGQTSFQPIHVREVAACFARSLEDPGATIGQTFELGGGKIYTYEEIIETIKQALGVSKPGIHMPVPLMKIVVRLSKPLPGFLRPPVTLEQLRMLELHNITSESATRQLIGVAPRALEDDLDYIVSSPEVR